MPETECQGYWRFAGEQEDGEGGRVERMKCSECDDEMYIKQPGGRLMAQKVNGVMIPS